MRMIFSKSTTAAQLQPQPGGRRRCLRERSLLPAPPSHRALALTLARSFHPSQVSTKLPTMPRTRLLAAPTVPQSTHRHDTSPEHRHTHLNGLKAMAGLWVVSSHYIARPRGMLSGMLDRGFVPVLPTAHRPLSTARCPLLAARCPLPADR